MTDPPRRRRVLIVRATIAIGIAGASAALLGSQLRDLPDTAAAVASADSAWLAAAGGLSIASMLMLTAQHAVLLRALGIDLPARNVLGLTYAQTSITLSVPGGSALATAFAVRRLRARGASVDVSIGAVGLSGAASVLALASSYVVGALLLGGAAAGPLQISATVATLALTLAVPVGVRSLPERAARRWRARAASSARRLRAPAFVVRRWRRMHRSRKLTRDTFTALSALRDRDWHLAVLLAALNWLTDMATLVAAGRSLGVALDPRLVGVAYLAVQAGRYLSVLPGGLGVVEPALVVILTSAHLDLPTAVAIVLVYRLFSHWLVALLGLPLWIRPAGRPARARSVDATPACERAGNGGSW